MCGIVGYVGKENAIEKLHNGLKNLEYRGYDSAGISYFNNHKLETIRSIGKVENLFKKVDDIFNKKENRPTSSMTIGIGHTRWATHGSPCEENSHPHQSYRGKVSIVHNGIIENYSEIKNVYLIDTPLLSETDTEVAANLLERKYIELRDKTKAIDETMKILRGSFAFAILFSDDPYRIYFAKRNSPLLIGLSKTGNFISSDILGFDLSVNHYVDVEDDQFGWISKNDFKVYRKNALKINPVINSTPKRLAEAELGGFPHYMLKEIYEIKKAINDTFEYYQAINSLSFLKKLENLSNVNRVHLIACGTSYHACRVGEIWLREIGIDATSDIASEFIYSPQKLDKKTLCIFVSQSGETADTLTAIKIAKKCHAKTIGITNVETSSISKLCDLILPTKCGVEIAVASTKAYNGQLCVLQILTLYLKALRKTKNYFANQDKRLSYKNSLIKVVKRTKEIEKYKKILKIVQKNIKKTQKNAKKIEIPYFDEQIKPLVKFVLSSKKIFMVGKNYDCVLAMEAALKLKEISYLSAEAYPSGELKHGTISLVDNETFVIAFLTEKKLTDKTMNIIRQTQSRGAKVAVVTPFENLIVDKCVDAYVKLPVFDENFYPITSIIPMQLLAYRVSTTLGNNPDKPRNLAKSVTVE